MITTDIDLAKRTLDRGDLIALPTETVYGLAGNAFSELSVHKIFALKQRPLYNPLIVHIKSADYLREVAHDIPLVAQQLADSFWPGPLTLVLKKKSVIPDIVTAGKDTVAVRVPKHQVALQLLEKLSFPLAAPSANPFGSISPTSASHVLSYFKDKLEIILDGGECEKGIESTIIGFENDQAIVYRLGSLSIEEIEQKIGKVLTHTHDDTAPNAPGMLSRHYAPTTETLLTSNISSLVSTYAGEKIGLLAFKEVPKEINVTHQEVLSKSGNLEEAAKNLYACMHRLDKMGLDLIIAERLPNVGLGKTLNDKLQRATKK